MPELGPDGKLYHDDRMYVLTLCRGIVSEVKPCIIETKVYHDAISHGAVWCIATYANSPGYPAVRIDHFPSRDAAQSYIEKTEPTVPLISLGGQAPNDPLPYNQYVGWKNAQGFKDYSYPESGLFGDRVGDRTEIFLSEETVQTLDVAEARALRLQEQGDLAGAESLLRRVLAGSDTILGSDHPATLAAAMNLATLHFEQREYTAAEPLFRRALAGEEEILGPEHPSTLKTVMSLANLCSRRGEFSEADRLFRRAIAGMEKANGPHHLDTLGCVMNYAIMLGRQRAFARAEPLFRRALSGYEDLLGLEHPTTRRCAQNFAVMTTDQGRI